MNINVQHHVRRILIFIAAIAVLIGTSIFAQTTTNSKSNLLGVMLDVPLGENEILQTVLADTTRAIFKQFKIDNPDAREHKLSLVSEAFEEDPSNPAVKLERMWVGSKGTLLEITGLQRLGQPSSAIISPDTLQLTNLKTTQTSRLVTFDGVTQVKDQRGRVALILKPRDTMFLLMEPIDGFQPYSLDYLGWDRKSAKYFDRIDPLFRERYDRDFNVASNPAATPDQMKDFLIDFAKNDPDKRAAQVFVALIGRMRAQNTFEGYYNAYLLIKDPADAKAARLLVRTDDHRKKMDEILAEEQRQIEVKRKIDEERRAETAKRQAALAIQAAEEKCLRTPSCVQQREQEQRARVAQEAERMAACRPKLEACYDGCARFFPYSGGFMAQLGTRILIEGCKKTCQGSCSSASGTSLGSLLGKAQNMIDGNNSTASSNNRVESNKPAKVNNQTIPSLKRYSCTVYCANGVTYYRGESKSRREFADWVGNNANLICRENKASSSSNKSFSESQCSEQ